MGLHAEPQRDHRVLNAGSIIPKYPPCIRLAHKSLVPVKDGCRTCIFGVLWGVIWLSPPGGEIVRSSSRLSNLSCWRGEVHLGPKPQIQFNSWRKGVCKGGAYQLIVAVF
jgi:hypothetical protein